MAGLTRAGAVELDRMDQTHLENFWHDTVEPFRVIGDAWKNDRQQFTQETLRAINLAFNPVLADEHGKRYFNGRSVIYWTGLGMLTWGAISACDYIWNRQPDGIPGPGGDSNPTPESLCNSLVQIAAVNSVDVAVSAPEWQAAGIDKSQLQQDIDCFAPDGGILSVAEVIKFGPNPGDIIAQLAWSKGGEVIPLLAVPGAQIDDLQLVQFLDPKTGQWEALSPDQAQTSLIAVNINSATGDIESENNGAVITATRDFNGNISFQIVNPDGTQAVLTADQIRNNQALVLWLTQVENLLKGQEMLSFEVVPGVDVGNIGEKYGLPQDVFAVARERHLAPIEAEGGIASACVNNNCTVMLTDVLVTGAKLQPATDGKVIYGFDGQAGSEALFRFSSLPEGVRVTALVAQEGNPWGLIPGTVVVWFWEGGGKGPATILNQDNPLQIMADSPNSISLTAIDNGLRITRIGPDGTVIDEQSVAFLPPLPSEFLAQFPDLQFQTIDNQIIASDGVVWFEVNEAGEWEQKVFTMRQAMIKMDQECDPYTKYFETPNNRILNYLFNKLLSQVPEPSGYESYSNSVGLDVNGYHPHRSCWYIRKENDRYSTILFGVLDKTDPSVLIAQELTIIDYDNDIRWDVWPPK